MEIDDYYKYSKYKNKYIQQLKQENRIKNLDDNEFYKYIKYKNKYKQQIQNYNQNGGDFLSKVQSYINSEKYNELSELINQLKNNPSDFKRITSEMNNIVDSTKCTCLFGNYDEIKKIIFNLSTSKAMYDDNKDTILKLIQLFNKLKLCNCKKIDEEVNKDKQNINNEINNLNIISQKISKQYNNLKSYLNKSISTISDIEITNVVSYTKELENLKKEKDTVKQSILTKTEELVDKVKNNNSYKNLSSKLNEILKTNKFIKL